MKLFTAWQMQHWDAYTIKHQQISSIDLMERASQACTDWIIQQEFGAPGTPDFQQNLTRLRSLTTDIHYLQSAQQFPPIDEEDVVIDTLFGFGLNRPLSGLYQELVQHINNQAQRVIAIDVPSGLF